MRFPAGFKAIRRGAAATIISVLVAGCANLSAVREFAKTSASTADYKQVVQDYMLSPVRQKRYQPERMAAPLDLLASRRAEQGQALRDAQQVLVDYMAALAALAADEVPSVDSQIDGISTALERAKFVGDADRQIGKETASAAAAIAKVLIRVALDGWRQREIVKIVRQTDPSLQQAIAGLQEVLDKDLRVSLDNEAVAVAKPFRAWQAAATSGNDPDGAPPVARILLDERLDLVKVKIANLDAYLRVLDAIAAGHADLTVNVDHLGNAEVKSRIKQYSKDIQSLYKSIKQLGN